MSSSNPPLRFRPRSMPNIRAVPLPRDMDLKRHLSALRQQAATLQARQRQQEIDPSRGLVALTKREQNRALKAEAEIRLRVVIGSFSFRTIAKEARLHPYQVASVLKGQREARFTVYIRLVRAIQRLARTHRVVIDKHLIRALRDPIP